MDDILDKHNRHLFLEEQDNAGNSFIANVNFLVNKFSDIQTINSKFTASDIASIRRFLDAISEPSSASQSDSNSSDDESIGEGSTTQENGSEGPSQGSQGQSSEGQGTSLGAVARDLLKGTYRGCRKLDVDLLLNFKDYDANLSDEEKRALWNDESKQVYYDSVDVYFTDKTSITKQFYPLVSNHHQLREHLREWTELSEKMEGTGIEIMPHEPIYNHELLRIYDTTLNGSTIERIVLHVADTEQCSNYKASFSGAKSLAPEYCWMDTTSSLQLIAGLLPELLNKSETALVKAREAESIASDAEELVQQAKDARDQACECSQEAESARQEVAGNAEAVAEHAAQILANIASTLASAEAAGISARTAQASADAAKASEELAYRHSTNAAVDVLEKVQAGLITAKYENYPEYLQAYLDADGNFLFGIKIDGSIEWTKGIPEGIREALNSIGKYTTDIGDYLRAYTDNEGNLIWGIKKDGSIEWTKGVPEGIKSYLNEHYGEIKTDNTYLHKYEDSEGKFVFGIKKDGSINWAKGVPDGLKEYLDNTYGYETANSEYLKMYADADGKFIFGIKKDGSLEWLTGVPTAIKNYFETYMYKDASGSLDMMSVRDKNSNVIEAIDYNGDHIFNSDVVINGDLILDGDLKKVEKVKGVHNWSKKKDLLHIPIPECAVVKIEKFTRPANKIDTCNAKMEFWDMRGNYFEKKIAIGLQGNSTWNLPKPNYKFDLFAKDWDGDEFEIKFGDWVAQDSFHLKAFYTDFLCGRAIVVYQWWQEICKTRGIFADTTWKQALLNKDEVPINMPALGAEEDVELRLDTGAKCVPDGFPCIVYINDKFHGIFSWQLKKHKDNYHLKKNNAKNIHVDGFTGPEHFWMGKVMWYHEEIRYPKDLFCYDGTIYDGDLNIQEILGDEEGSLGYKASSSDPYPLEENYQDYMDLTKGYWKDVRKKGKEAYDEAIAEGKTVAKAEQAQVKAEKKAVKKTIEITISTKHNMERVSQAIPQLRVLDEEYKADPTPEKYQAVRDLFEQYFYPDNLIDYNILIDLDGDWDSTTNNCQWLTWDGKIWFANVYDCNGTFGGNGRGNSALLTDHRVTSSKQPFYYAHTYYKEETEARYAYLRQKGLLDVDYIMGKLNDWVKRIGVEYYAQEFETWYQQPSINNATINDQYWKLMKDGNGNPITGDTNTYDPYIDYEVDDEVVSSFAEWRNLDKHSTSFAFNANYAGKYRFKCIKANRGIFPFRNNSIADNIWHLYKWYEQQLTNMDLVYNYSI